MRKFSVPALASFRSSEGEVIDIAAILNAPYEDIGEAAAVIPPHLGWLGYQKAAATERIINNKHRFKEAEAKAYFALKNGEFVARGYGEKITEAALEHAVNLDPDVIAASEAYAKAEKDYERFAGTIEALKAKMELCRSSETTRRMEHEPDRNKGTLA